MSWIQEVTPEQAEGTLKTLYDELQKKRGKIANILQVHSLRPEAMRAHVGLYMDLMFASGGLSRLQRELIAVVVSRANSCEYCVAHHAEALARYIGDKEQLDAIARGELPDELQPATRALARYAANLTRNPSACCPQDIEALREAGFQDSDILLANLIVAYFNFVNRIALGLGVSFSESEVSGYDV